MTIKYKRAAISVFAISLMLLGMTLLPVKAAFVPTQLEYTEQDLIADENGHTYLYSPGFDDIGDLTFYQLVHDEDIDMTSYDYVSDSWSTSTSSYTGPASRTSYPLGLPDSGQGWLDEMGRFYPTFVDYANTTNDPLSVSIVNERYTFPLTVGEESSIIAEPGYMHFGTFNITTEEFMYLTVGSRSDLVDAMFLILDPDGTILMEGGISGGNMDLFPFLPSGIGMYTLFIQFMTYDDNLHILDLLLEEATPIDLLIGDFVEGELNGSEYITDSEDGSLVHQEKAPGAVTYMVHTNFTTPGVITHSMNLPEIDTDIYNWYDPWFHVTSNSQVSSFFDSKYQTYFDPNDGPFYYQSFQNETYYITVIGMENVEYMLHNEYAMIDELPVNEKFYLENSVVEDEVKAFTLALSQDSVLRVNSTEGTYGYKFNLFSVFEDNNYMYLSISDSSSFDNAQFYYIPAGEYIVRATCSDSEAWGFYDFNLGPVIDGLGSVSVDVGSVAGLRFDTNVLDWYNISISFDTHDNVSVNTDVYIFNTFGGQIGSYDQNMGNRQSGLGWVEYPSNYSTYIQESFSDGFGIVAISPYYVQNNTAGLVDDEYGEYTLDYSVAVDDGIPWVFNDTATTSFTSGWYNFTLGDIGDPIEDYLLTVSGDIGEWVNVSVYVEDVVDWWCTIFQVVDGTPQYLYWDSLDDNFVGSYTGEAAFQFGCISENITMYFEVERTQVGEGRLDIAFDLLTTNTFEYMPPLMFQGEVVTPGVDMGLAVVGIGATIAIVVVLVVIVKKKPELLRRS